MARVLLSKNLWLYLLILMVFVKTSHQQKGFKKVVLQALDKIQINMKQLEKNQEMIMKTLNEIKVNATTCATTIESPQKCEKECPPGDGWVKNNGNCFYFSTGRASWNGARANCQKLGASIDLAELGNPCNSKSDIWLMETLLNKSPTSIGQTWLGGYSPTQQNDGFIWAHSGRSLTNSSWWAPNEPWTDPALPGEWCVMTWAQKDGHRLLNNGGCNGGLYYVCQQF